MKKLLLYLALPLVLLAVFVGFDFKSNGGKAGFTGSPGENTCAQCHNSFELNSGNGQLMIHSAAIDSLESGYYADSTYEIDVTVKHEGATLFGFALEALNSAGENAGTLNITQSQLTQLMNANVGGNSRTNIVHKKNSGVANDSITFTFSWTAPKEASDITFYAVGNAANKNGANSGDYIYSLSKAVTKKELPVDTTTAIFEQTPVISVYPNPTQHHITINVPNGLLKPIFIIYNSAGQIIATEVRPNFDVSSFPAGIYWVVVSSFDNEKSAVAQFIKK